MRRASSLSGSHPDYWPMGHTPGGHPATRNKGRTQRRRMISPVIGASHVVAAVCGCLVGVLSTSLLSGALLPNPDAPPARPLDANGMEIYTARDGTFKYTVGNAAHGTSDEILPPSMSAKERGKYMVDNAHKMLAGKLNSTPFDATASAPQAYPRHPAITPSLSLSLSLSPALSLTHALTQSRNHAYTLSLPCSGRLVPRESRGGAARSRQVAFVRVPLQATDARHRLQRALTRGCPPSPQRRCL